MTEVKTSGKHVMVKVRQARSDERRDDISKNLFTFGQTFRLEECKQFELINAPVCVFERARETGTEGEPHALQKNASKNVFKKIYSITQQCPRLICSLKTNSSHPIPHNVVLTLG